MSLPTSPSALAWLLTATLSSMAAGNELPRVEAAMHIDADGTCMVGFEASSFRPRLDHKPTPMEFMEGNWWVTAWGDTFVGPPAPPGPGRSRSLVWACRVTGALSPPGRYGHMNMYSHELRIIHSEFIPAPDSAP